MNNREKYKILIAARNFHYDNYNKWMTYFYVAIGSLFLGYTTVVSSENPDALLSNLIPVLGYITSLLWYWSAKGYYYWNINFINLVNYYERDILKFPKKERIYFVFANKKTENNYLSPISGANISTSKVTILFAFIISFVWGIILIAHFLKNYFDRLVCECIYDSIFIQIIASLILTLSLTYIVPRKFLKSNQKKFPDLKFEL